LLGRFAVQDKPKGRISAYTMWNVSVWRCCSRRNVAETDLVLREYHRQVLKCSRAFVCYSQSRLVGLATHAQAENQHGREGCHPPTSGHSLRLAEVRSFAEPLGMADEK
jgi:hypothetical protein